MSRVYNICNIYNAYDIIRPVVLGVNFSVSDYVGAFNCGHIDTTTFMPAETGSTYRCWVFRIDGTHQYVRTVSNYCYVCDDWDKTTYELINGAYLGNSGVNDVSQYSGKYLIVQDEGSGYASYFSNPYGRGAWWEDRLPLYQQNQIDRRLAEEFASFIELRLAGKSATNPRCPTALDYFKTANGIMIDVKERPDISKITSFHSLYSYNHRVTNIKLTNEESAKVTSMAYFALAADYLKTFECGDLPKCSSLGTAFRINRNLTSVKIGRLKAGCNTANAFQSCSNLVTCNIEWLDTIGSAMFYSCSKLVHFNIPSEVTSIPNNAFRGCNKLDMENLPDGITSIGEYGFYNNENLRFTKLPRSLKSIGTYGLRYCSKLEIEKLPPNLETIGSNCFQSDTSIKFNVFPYSIKSIASQAFYQCWNTTDRKVSLYFEGIPTSIASNVFSLNNYLQHIYVPWDEGEVANAPWNATKATIHYMVPAGFRRLEYLECTGQQWIDTLHTVTSETRIRMVVFEANSGSLFECYDSTRKYWGCQTENVNNIIGIRYGLFHGSTQKGAMITEGKMAEVGYEEDGNMNFCLNGNIVGEKSYSTISSYAINIPLFGFKNANSNPISLFSGKVGMTFISVKGENIKHFIPCLCLAGTTYIDAYTGNQVIAEADKPGYIEGFSGEFYTNKGTGDDFLYLN